MIKGCLALGVIRSTHQFQDFILKATEHFSLRLRSRIIPHHGYEGPHHQGTHPRRLFKCVMPLTLHVHDRGHDYSNSFNSADVYIFTHTIRSSMPSKDMKCRNEAHILHQPS